MFFILMAFFSLLRNVICNHLVSILFLFLNTLVHLMKLEKFREIKFLANNETLVITWLVLKSFQ